MRFLLVLAFATVALAGTVLPQQGLRPLAEMADSDGEIDFLAENQDGTVEIAPSFIVSWQVRRMIRKIQKQMPCGWPQYGIPPLAPLKVREAEIELKKGIFETIDKVFKFRIDGLDKFVIQQFKLNVIKSKITFDFLFKDIVTSASKYDTNSILDAMRQLGLSVQYEGEGTLDFGLKNLRIAGTIKYKIPILWGSIKITSMKTQVSLGACTSEITGFMGNGAVNRMINRQIENVVEMGINNNQEAISDMIEETLVPKVNKMLKGNDFWTIIDMIFSSTEGEQEDDPIVVNCVPPQDPWA
ncbi:uncharacterized protein LOC133324441 [Musca vetustissima]|uniref:uncharacterized protein LOC133324441 n=1 Tax=Musca vetustissima TaxID=27455 RepID=UPI002AB77B21|nr:uncharacterized protein LOC133324441 [Musca vetustissima]